MDQSSGFEQDGAGDGGGSAATLGDVVLEALSAVRSSITELSQAALWARSDTGSRAAVREGFAVLQSLHAAWLGLVADLDRRPEAVPGARAGQVAATFLHAGLLRTSRQAAADVRAAHVLGAAGDVSGGGLPELGRAFAAGLVSREHVDVAVRTVAKLPKEVLSQPVPADPASGSAEPGEVQVLAGAAVDAFFAQQSQQHDPAGTQRLARHLLAALDPDGQDGFDPHAVDRRSLNYGTDSAGMVAGRFVLDPVSGAWLTQAIGQFSAPDPTTDEPTQDGSTTTRVRDPRTAGQRRADALATIARLALGSTDAGTSKGGEPPRIVIHTGLQETLDALHHTTSTPPAPSSASRQPAPRNDAAGPQNSKSPPNSKSPLDSGSPQGGGTSDGADDPQSDGSTKADDPQDAELIPGLDSAPDSSTAQRSDRAQEGDRAQGGSQVSNGDAQDIHDVQDLGSSESPDVSPPRDRRPPPELGGSPDRGRAPGDPASPERSKPPVSPARSKQPAPSARPALLPRRGSDLPALGPIGPTLLGRFVCDSILQKALLSEKGAILDLGREVRTVSRAQRRALHARDRGCVIPGCVSPPEWCEGHHVIWWRNGGRTDINNLALVCGRHHDLVHLGIWDLQMIDGVPWARPPAWIDPLRRPIRNTLHHSADQARTLGIQLCLGDPPCSGGQPDPRDCDRRADPRDSDRQPDLPEGRQADTKDPPDG